MTDLIKKATEYKQNSGITMYVISFMVGILIIIAGYTLLKAVADYIGLWATVVIIAVMSILLVRKL